jgi:hypothetical protein
MADTFDVGDKPVFTATFKNTAEALTDPSTVIFIWRTPAGVETSYTYGVDSQVTKTSTGVYAFAAPTVAASGRHWCRAKGTAGLIAAAEYPIQARISAFTTEGPPVL